MSDTERKAWYAERARLRAACDRVDGFLGDPKRERPRDPDEAELLRELGTPENLIGPVPDRSELEQVRALLGERFAGDEGAAERWLWYEPNPDTDGIPPVGLLVQGRFDDVLRAAERTRAAA